MKFNEMPYMCINCAEVKKEQAALTAALKDAPDYAAAKEVYASGEPAEHLVEIVMQEGDRDKLFTLLGFLMAD